MSRGIVYLVGAGPGDPDLLTVRAVELLRTADVVAHDKLIPATILSLANPDAERLAVGRRRGDAKRRHVLDPEVLARARAGRRVVRLKAGDPLIFGRGAEEAQELVDAGIPFEIVPGVSAALGAAAYAAIPLTDRRCASSVTFTTGHDGHPTHVDLEGTIVLYMGAHRLRDNLLRLAEAGRALSTPAAYVERATERDQRVVVGTIADLADQVEADASGGPALVIVGEVVRFRQKIAWRERRPLSGKSVLVARARPGDSQIAKELRSLGADVLEAPTVTVADLPDSSALVVGLAHLSSYAGVVFACEAGVERALRILAQSPDLGAALRSALVIAVGAGTIAALHRGGWPPRIEVKGACRDELVRYAPRLRMAPVLLVASEEGRPSLVDDLSALGVRADTVAAYALRRGFDVIPESAPDLVVVPSSSAADAVLRGPLRSLLSPVTVLAVGPKSEEAARKAGAANVIRSRHDSVPSIVASALALLGPTKDTNPRQGPRPPRPTHQGSTT